jgi:hypothetical protein
MKQFESKWHQTITAIDKNVWNKIFKNETIKSYGLFASMEAAGINDVEFYFLEVTKFGQTIALLPCFYYRLDLSVLSTESLKKQVNKIRTFYPRFMTLKVFGIGSLAATCEQHIGVDENLSKNEIRVLGNIINQQIKDKSKKMKCPLVLIKEVPVDDMDFVKSLFFEDFYFYDSLPNTFIPINNSFAPYPIALKKKERKRFKDSKIEFEANFTWEIVTDFSIYNNVFEKQYLNVLNKSKNKFETMNKAFFDHVNQRLENKSFLLICRDAKNKIRSTELVIEEENKLIPMYLGIDYTACTEHEVRLIYFNTIFKTISEAENRNKEMVVLGQTSYYPKIMSGAIVKRLFLGFYSNNKVLQYFIQRYFGLLFKETIVHNNIYKKEWQDELKQRYPNAENI